MHRRVLLAALAAGFTLAAHAEIYRCVIDGRTTFRDRPCASAASQSMVAQANDKMAGCYEVNSPGWESGRQIYTINLSATAPGKFVLWQSGPDPNTKVPMRRARATELRDATRLLQFSVTDAIVMEVLAGMPNQPAIPIGLYKGLDEHRDPTWFFFGFMSNGRARPVACK
jgi:hypothetical protein